MAHSAGCGRSTLPPTRARARSWTMSAEWHRRTAPRRALRASGGGRRCTSLAANQRARHHRRAQNDGGSKAANPLVPARQPRAAGGARVAPRTVTSTRYESVEIAARRRATGASRLCIGTGDLGNRAEGQLLLACPGHARLVAGGFHRLWAGDRHFCSVSHSRPCSPRNDLTTFFRASRAASVFSWLAANARSFALTPGKCGDLAPSLPLFRCGPSSLLSPLVFAGWANPSTSTCTSGLAQYPYRLVGLPSCPMGSLCRYLPSLGS